MTSNLEEGQRSSEVRQVWTSMPPTTRLFRPMTRARDAVRSTTLPVLVSGKWCSSTGSVEQGRLASIALRSVTSFSRRMRLNSTSACVREIVPDAVTTEIASIAV